MESSDIQSDAEFSDAERDAVYRCIFNRRDVRAQFLSDPIPDQILARLLHGASCTVSRLHAAVGFHRCEGSRRQEENSSRF